MRLNEYGTDYYDRHGKPLDREAFYASWGEPAEKYVRKTMVGKVEISTVWLGIDHAYSGGPPIIFETLVFGGKHADDGERYATEAEAIEGHDRWVREVQGWLRWLRPARDVTKERIVEAEKAKGTWR
jgi:hypothetical protein